MIACAIVAPKVTTLLIDNNIYVFGIRSVVKSNVFLSKEMEQESHWWVTVLPSACVYQAMVPVR